MRGSLNFAVFVAWATVFVCFMITGAIIPLLPIYVQEFSETKSQQTDLTNFVKNSTNVTAVTAQCQHNTTGNTQNDAVSRIVGALLGIGNVAEMLASPFVGFAIDKIGYDIPLFIGYAVQVGVSLGYAFVEGEVVLFVVRIMHGIGNAILRTSVFTLVADIYKDDDTLRGTMIGYAACGVSAGFMIGPPFASVMYQFGSKMLPFVCIAALLFCIAILRLSIRIPRVNKIESRDEKVSSWKMQLRLLLDPYVNICLLLMLLSMSGIGFLEATLPLHMLSTICPEKWMLGVVFLPLEISFAIGTPFQSWMTRQIGRWPVAVYSYILSTAPFLAYPFCRRFFEFLFPALSLGVTSAARNTAVLPILTYLVHTRYGPSAYGSAYALVNITFSIGIGAGPLLASILVPVIGFGGVMYLAASLSFVAIVPLAFLRKPLAEAKSDEEKTPLNVASSGEKGEDLPAMPN